METIIGLGSAGCGIAAEFEKYDVYDVYKIDTDLTPDKKNIFVDEKATQEDYEKSTPSYKKRFSKIKNKKVLFIVCGSGKIAGMSLKILEQLKNKEISVLYVKPDIELLTSEAFLRERLVYNVFQQYTRSGLFKSLILVNNLDLEEVLGGLTINNYYNKINELLASIIHMINVFDHTEAVIDNSTTLDKNSNICTLGIIDFAKGEEKLFFPIDQASDGFYYYAIRNKILEEDNKIFTKIREQVKVFSQEDKKVSYSIHSTDYDQNFGYCMVYSDQPQEIG